MGDKNVRIPLEKKNCTLEQRNGATGIEGKWGSLENFLF